MSQSKVIESLDELIALASRPKGLDCFIVLAGGAARSSKHIDYLAPSGRYRVGRFDILHEIDGVWQTLWPKQLWTMSNIGEALDKRALVAWL